MAKSGAFYIVDEVEQVVITQFGNPVGKPITKPGLNFKLPVIQKVNIIDKRMLELDGQPTMMTTRDKTYIIVDTFARWRIVDPLLYIKRLKNFRSARSRLEDILESETQLAVAKHDLIEIIRTDKDRQPTASSELEVNYHNKSTSFDKIKYGRTYIQEEIKNQASEKLSTMGIELLDLRFKRINYNSQVEKEIFNRMISERKQISDRFRSQGAGRAAEILGDMEKELNKIESEAYKKEQKIIGEAEAKATEIYAKTYSKNQASRNLYKFVKTLDIYTKIINNKTSLVLSTKSDLFNLLKNLNPQKEKSQTKEKSYTDEDYAY